MKTTPKEPVVSDGNFENIGKKLDDGVQVVKNAGRAVKEKAKDAGRAVGNGIVTAGKAVGKGVKKVGEKIHEVGSATKKKLKKVGEAVGNGIVATGKKIHDLGSAAKAKVKRGVKKTVAFFAYYHVPETPVSARTERLTRIIVFVGLGLIIFLISYLLLCYIILDRKNYETKDIIPRASSYHISDNGGGNSGLSLSKTQN